MRGAELEGGRQRRVELAGRRYRRVHVLAGIAIGIERCFRRRAQRLAGLLVIGKARRHRGEGDREIGAVAGAHAHRAIGAGHRAEIAARRSGHGVAEQAAEETARALALFARGRRVLRAAIVLRQRRQHRAALVLAVGAAEPAAAQALQAGGDLVEIAAHLLDLVVDRTALRRILVEQREKAGAVAAHALGLRGDAVELALLARLRLLVAADLLVLGGIAGAGAAVDGGKLHLEPLAYRIARRRAGLGRTARHLGKAVVGLRESIAGDRNGGGKQGAGEEPPGEGIGQRLQHIRPSNDFAGGHRAEARGRRIAARPRPTS